MWFVVHAYTPFSFCMSTDLNSIRSFLAWHHNVCKNTQASPAKSSEKADEEGLTTIRFWMLIKAVFVC